MFDEIKMCVLCLLQAKSPVLLATRGGFTLWFQCGNGQSFMDIYFYRRFSHYRSGVMFEPIFQIFLNGPKNRCKMNPNCWTGTRLNWCFVSLPCLMTGGPAASTVQGPPLPQNRSSRSRERVEEVGTFQLTLRSGHRNQQKNHLLFNILVNFSPDNRKVI